MNGALGRTATWRARARQKTRNRWPCSRDTTVMLREAPGSRARALTGARCKTGVARAHKHDARNARGEAGRRGNALWTTLGG